MQKLLIGLLAVFCAALGGALWYQSTRPPQIVTKEVPVEKRVEVPKEVIREVPVEKRVPVEVKVPVEVIKEVEKPLTAEQKMQMSLGARLLAATLAVSSENRMKGIEEVSIEIYLAEEVKKIVNETDIRNGFEMALRRNGIKVNEKSFDSAVLSVEGFWTKDRTQMIYNCEYGVEGYVTIGRGGSFRFFKTWIESDTKYGMAGSEKIREALLNLVGPAADDISLRLLKANEGARAASPAGTGD